MTRDPFRSILVTLVAATIVAVVVPSFGESPVELDVHEFLLPVVAHVKGSRDTEWRTDVHIFNTDPLTGPMQIEHQRGGEPITKSIVMTRSTEILEDVLTIVSKTDVVPDQAGPVFVRVRSISQPRVWSRTYTVDRFGLHGYGQLLPAVPIEDVREEDERVTYVVPWLEISDRFRTSLGLVNPTARTVSVNVMARDDSALGFRIGEFDVLVPPFALVRVGDLANRIDGLTGSFSLVISALGNEPIFVYGSMIDQITNDPVIIAGVRDIDQTGLGRKRQIVPGTVHFEQSTGTWRSDLVVYNPDVVPIHFDVVYYDDAGNSAAETMDLPLGSGAFVRVEDVLEWGRLEPDPGDSFGLLEVTIRESVNVYPIVFQRTYEDRGELGTYGQVIGAVAPDEANVTASRPAYLPIVGSTKLGLVLMGEEPSEVAVSLLDEFTGNVVGTWRHMIGGRASLLEGHGSLVVADIIRTMSLTESTGTLKVELLSGGDVHAHLSVFTGTNGAGECSAPEHVPTDQDDRRALNPLRTDCRTDARSENDPNEMLLHPGGDHSLANQKGDVKPGSGSELAGTPYFGLSHLVVPLCHRRCIQQSRLQRVVGFTSNSRGASTGSASRRARHD